MVSRAPGARQHIGSLRHAEDLPRLFFGSQWAFQGSTPLPPHHIRCESGPTDVKTRRPTVGSDESSRPVVCRKSHVLRPSSCTQCTHREFVNVAVKPFGGYQLAALSEISSVSTESADAPHDLMDKALAAMSRTFPRCPLPA